jgi:hypothetical protein
VCAVCAGKFRIFFIPSFCFLSFAGSDRLIVASLGKLPAIAPPPEHLLAVAAAIAITLQPNKKSDRGV